VLEHRTRIRGHERTRRDHATELTQDYVEAIAELIQKTGECRVRDLSMRFAVSHVTVNRAVARMKRDGYVDTEPYAPVTLTDKGKTLAEFAERRHRIVFQFLRALGVSERTAAIDSEGNRTSCERRNAATDGTVRNPGRRKTTGRGSD
jgi:DtxR family manganese transport transcriptional regulator